MVHRVHVRRPGSGNCLHQLVHDVEDPKACAAVAVRGERFVRARNTYPAPASTASCAAQEASWSARLFRAAGCTTWTAAAQPSERRASATAKRRTHPHVRARRVPTVSGKQKASVDRHLVNCSLGRPAARLRQLQPIARSRLADCTLRTQESAARAAVVRRKTAQ